MPGSHPQQGVTEGVHIAYQWSFADATARASATDPRTGVGYQAADLGKFCRQTDDNSIWMLTATTPTWQNVGGGSGRTLPTAIEGNILVGNATPAWALLDASTTGAILVGNGTTAISTTTPTFVGNVTFNAAILQPSGQYVRTDEVRAVDGDGLNLYDDGGNGITVKDGGNVGIGETSPDEALHVKTNGITSCKLEGTLAGFTWRESDQTLPVGLWRMLATGGNVYLQENTAVAGNFSSVKQTMVWFSGGNVVIGSAIESSKMGLGLLIDQGANDNEILAFQSSNISHPYTANADADIYASFRKRDPAYGGLLAYGFSENNSANKTAIQISAYVGYTALDTTISTAARGGIVHQVYKYSGSSTTPSEPSGAEHLMTVQAGTTTRFILQANGNLIASNYTTYTANNWSGGELSALINHDSNTASLTTSWQTLTTLTTTRSTYILTLVSGNGQVAALAFISSGSSSPVLTSLVTTSTAQVQMSGYNVQASVSSGTAAIKWAIHQL